MSEYLLEKLKEIQEKIQALTVKKINLGMSLSFYKKLDEASREYYSYCDQAKKSMKMTFKTTLEIIGLLIWFAVLDIKTGLFLKFCIGGLGCIDVACLALLISEIKNIHKYEHYLIENGYDPSLEFDMQKIKSNQDKLEDEYKETDDYLDELLEVKEDLHSMMDSNDLSNGMEKYPELLEDILNIEFEEYMRESVKPEIVDLEPIVKEEELIWNSPHQLKLK